MAHPTVTLHYYNPDCRKKPMEQTFRKVGMLIMDGAGVLHNGDLSLYLMPGQKPVVTRGKRGWMILEIVRKNGGYPHV